MCSTINEVVDQVYVQLQTNRVYNETTGDVCSMAIVLAHQKSDIDVVIRQYLTTETERTPRTNTGVVFWLVWGVLNV